LQEGLGHLQEAVGIGRHFSKVSVRHCTLQDESEESLGELLLDQPAGGLLFGRGGRPVTLIIDVQ
jgi:hypothetical protein